jgi:hypothetical protein
VRARTADLYRVKERSNGASSSYECLSEHSVTVRAVRNSKCSFVVPTRTGWQTAFGNWDNRDASERPRCEGQYGITFDLPDAKGLPNWFQSSQSLCDQLCGQAYETPTLM